jgi:choline kinase
LKKDLDIFRKELDRVDNQDYFEKALENLTISKKIHLKPVDVGALYCNEIDFEEDLKAVRKYLLTRNETVNQQCK